MYALMKNQHIEQTGTQSECFESLLDICGDEATVNDAFADGWRVVPMVNQEERLAA